jgi:hypothetical protein
LNTSHIALCAFFVRANRKPWPRNPRGSTARSQKSINRPAIKHGLIKKLGMEQGMTMV